VTARDRTILLVVAALAALAGFWFLLLDPKRQDASEVSTQVTAAHKRLDTARAAAADADAARRRYANDYATVARLGKAVPLQDDVPSLVYQLQSSAFRNDLDFRSIKLEASAAAAPPSVTNAKAVASATENTAAAGATSGAATSAVAAVLPPGATVGPAGFPTMPFSFSFDGGFFDMQHFLRAINGFTTVKGKRIDVRGRLLSVDGFALSASRAGFPQVKASIRATAYLLPSAEGATGGATPAAPAGGSQSASSSSSTAPTTSAAATSIAGGNR